jgi:hypothetical protein
VTLAERMPRLVARWRERRGGAGDPSAKELREIAAAIGELSQGLTRERELAGARYLDRPELGAAYLLFWWPISYAQARSVLAELPSVPARVLDVGAGPAPMAIAALDAGAREAIAIDRSEPALADARALEPRLSTAKWQPGAPLPSGPFDAITCGHLLNELPEKTRDELVAALLERLAPGGSLVLIEPALRETSRALLELRDRLVARGVAVRAPCLWRGGCPALHKASDWCHAERPFEPPPLVDELARLAKLHKDALKMSYLVLAPPGEAWPTVPEGRLFRIVSEPLGTKGRARFVGCGPEGRVPLVLADKHRAPHNHAFFDLQRGDVVRIGATDEKGDGLALKADSAVELLRDGF